MFGKWGRYSLLFLIGYPIQALIHSICYEPTDSGATFNDLMATHVQTDRIIYRPAVYTRQAA